MRLLDLFCGAGGCSVGYARAGFEVVGVDHRPQPRYPFEFVQADALEYVAQHGHKFDAIHASPPCQKFTAMQNAAKNAHLHPDMLEPVRALLVASGKPWVIENVQGAPMLPPTVMLCGSMFGLKVRRHRLFETNMLVLQPTCECSGKSFVGVYGDHPEKAFVNVKRKGGVRRAETLQHGSESMGIDWMKWRELTQAIPPAYTEFIGHQLMEHCRRIAA